MIRIGLFTIFLALACQAHAVTTPFTVQGSLEDGGLPANGSYDLQFVPTTVNGTALTSPLTVEDVAVVGGVFTVELDFGSFVFTGSDRKLRVSVRPGASGGAFVPLSPDLSINASPYALTSTPARVRG